MTRDFHIDIKHQIKSMRECIKSLGWILSVSIALPIFFPNKFENPDLFVIALLFWTVTSFFLCIPFHINYFVANRGLQASIDDTARTITFKKSNKLTVYNLTDVKVTRHLCGHYSPDKTKSWIPIPFDYYGYLRVDTPDGDKYFLSSLMINPFEPPLKIDKEIYGFPFIITETITAANTGLSGTQRSGDSRTSAQPTRDNIN